ncbi:MAG: RNA polymerase sigma factor, partial [Isosphaeraceae bacterium]
MDPDDLGRLIDRHADSLRLYARQWTDMADDVVQEAFLSLARQRAEPENPAAWLFRAVRNGAIN